MTRWLVLGVCLLAVAAWGGDPMAAAQQFRGGQAVTAAPDGNLYCEAEEFAVKGKGWKAQPWGENYYAATIFNCFLSRKAFLGAPEQCPQTRATLTAEIPAAGRYLVLARYEAAYRFETQFRIQVAQGGKTVFDRLYGARNNLKVWVYGKGITEEADYPWGSSQSIVWEGHEAAVDLQPGPAVITLIAGPQPERAAKRNIDLVMLTRNADDVKQRIAKEGYLPLDGLLTQAGDVYLRVYNPGAAPVAVTVQTCKEHSPYWVHQRTWKPVTVSAAAGTTSEWTEIGSTMDALNDGQWPFQVGGPCTLEFGLRNAKGEIEKIRTLPVVAKGQIIFAGAADMRYSRRIRTQKEELTELMAALRKVKTVGKAPARVPVYQYSFELTGDPEYDAMVKEFKALFGLQDTDQADGYVDWRGQSPEQLKATCEKLTPEQRAAIRVVSLGDEIGLPAPGGAAATEGFIDYLKAQGLTPNEVDPASNGDWAKVAYSLDEKLRESKPGVFYWSRRYRHTYGIRQMKALTDVLRGYLPNAGIGANFSPHAGRTHAFLGETFQWVNCFREGGMTLPWSEDYAWQLPLGSQQVNGVNLDLFRAGLRGTPHRDILYYVMPHMPGNSPAMWRRLFYNALGHGMTMVDLFEFRPVWAAYTENHVTGTVMYAEVLRTLHELGQYEDIVATGSIPPAPAALWFSETGDIWGDMGHSGGAAKRSLYVALQHQQVPLDIVTETDTLDHYQVLYLADAHVSRAAARKIAAWVMDGGILVATAGAGMLDEYNQPNATLRALLGVTKCEMVYAPAADQVGFEKQDLPFVQPMDAVRGQRDGKPQKEEIPVFAALSRITVADAAVAGTFRDGSPAVAVRGEAKGAAIYLGFHPGLSYLRLALPPKPMDVNSRDDAYCQLLPVTTDPAVARLLAAPLSGLVRPVEVNADKVECQVIQAKSGTLVLFTNWGAGPIKGLRATLTLPVPTKQVTLASGKPVKVTPRKTGGVEVTFDLDVAEALILR